MATHATDVETLQKLAARIIATHPAGRNLLLIGGFRYRLLDHSVRTSDDIDYHWMGDLVEKQAELLELLQRKLIPEARRLLGYDGSVAPHQGPDADSPVVRIVDLAFWKQGVAYSRIEIPIEITRIMCSDPVHIRTVEGTIYATASDADMVESKIIAILNRHYLRHRDIVDLFLFQDELHVDARKRLEAKIAELGIQAEVIQKRIEDLRSHSGYHAKATQAIIDSQLDPVAAAQIGDAGGGTLVLSTVLTILEKLVEVSHEGS